MKPRIRKIPHRKWKSTLRYAWPASQLAVAMADDVILQAQISWSEYQTSVSLGFSRDKEASAGDRLIVRALGVHIHLAAQKEKLPLLITQSEISLISKFERRCKVYNLFYISKDY